MSNIINAIYNLVTTYPVCYLSTTTTSNNRVNKIGDALETYVKGLFAGTMHNRNTPVHIQISNTFSYTGNPTNPPDAMLWGGDAIEIKKISSDNADLPLNSSYPKQKLFVTSPMITNTCRNAEQWTVKDMLYCVGIVHDDVLKHLCMVYGLDFCASEETYTRLLDKIKAGIQAIPNIEPETTNEISRLNRVDPLGITYLRIRGMWGIENPFKVFDYVYQRKGQYFNFMCIINKEKYSSFDNRFMIENLVNKVNGFCISDIKIKNPDNPAQLKDAKLIVFER